MTTSDGNSFSSNGLAEQADALMKGIGEPIPIDAVPARVQIQAGSELDQLIALIRFAPGQPTGFLHSNHDANGLVWRWLLKWAKNVDPAAPQLVRDLLAENARLARELQEERDEIRPTATELTHLEVERVWREQLAAAEAELVRLRSEIAVAREACPAIRLQDNFDAPLIQLINAEVSRGFTRDGQLEELANRYAAERHDLKAEITRLRSSGGHREWQGIESAPKAEVFIDVWAAGSRVSEAFWDTLKNQWTLSHDVRMWRFTPTHWRKRPDPPVLLSEHEKDKDICDTCGGPCVWRDREAP